MTDEQLKAIWQRWGRSSPGEWTMGVHGVVAAVGDHTVVVCRRPHEQGAYSVTSDNNADFIANAHQDIPALRAHIEALTAENERLKKQVGKLERKVTAGDDLLYAIDRLVP